MMFSTDPDCPVDRDWKLVDIVVEGRQIKLCGINPWDFEWAAVEADSVVVSHPQYPLQRHEMSVWEIDTGKERIQFAAGEYSANVWGFYVREPA